MVATWDYHIVERERLLQSFAEKLLGPLSQAGHPKPHSVSRQQFTAIRKKEGRRGQGTSIPLERRRPGSTTKAQVRKSMSTTSAYGVISVKCLASSLWAQAMVVRCHDQPTPIVPPSGCVHRRLRRLHDSPHDTDATVVPLSTFKSVSAWRAPSGPGTWTKRIKLRKDRRKDVSEHKQVHIEQKL